MKRRVRAPIVYATLVLCTLAAVGVPLHGHVSHEGHDQAHIELAHHDHDADYVQGDARLIQHAPRLVVVAPVVPTIVDDAIVSRNERPTPHEPVGRAPPTPGSPRAPPS